MSNTASRPSDSRLDDSRPARRLDAENVRYPGFGPGSTVLKAGTQYQEGGLPLRCDIVFDRDIAVQLSDGTMIYTDLYRAVDGRDLATIVACSPYGKRGGTVLFFAISSSAVVVVLPSVRELFSYPRR